MHSDFRVCAPWTMTQLGLRLSSRRKPVNMSAALQYDDRSLVSFMHIDLGHIERSRHKPSGVLYVGWQRSYLSSSLHPQGAAPQPIVRFQHAR